MSWNAYPKARFRSGGEGRPMSDNFILISIMPEKSQSHAQSLKGYNHIILNNNLVYHICSKTASQDGIVNWSG